MANNENVNILAGNITAAEKAILKVIYKLCLEDPRGATPREIADEFEKSSSLLTTTNQYSYDAVKQYLGRITRDPYLADVISKNQELTSRYLYNLSNDKLNIGYELMLERILNGMNNTSNVKDSYKKIYDAWKSSCPLLIKYHKGRIQEYNYALIKDIFFDGEKGVTMLHSVVIDRYGFAKEHNIPLDSFCEVTPLSQFDETDAKSSKKIKKIKKIIDAEFEKLEENLAFTIEPALISFTYDMSLYNENFFNEDLKRAKEFFNEDKPKIQRKVKNDNELITFSFLTDLDKINKYLEDNVDALHIKISFLKTLSLSYGSIKKEKLERKWTKKLQNELQSRMQTPILYYAELISNLENLSEILIRENKLADINEKYYENLLTGLGDLPEFEEMILVDEKLIEEIKKSR